MVFCSWILFNDTLKISVVICLVKLQCSVVTLDCFVYEAFCPWWPP